MKSFFFLAFLFAATAARGQSSATTSSCSDGKWSTPVPLLTQDGRPAYVEPGSAAQFGDHVLMVGSPTFIWSSPDTFFPIDSVKVLRDSSQLIANFTRSGVLVGRDGMETALVRLGQDSLVAVWTYTTGSEKPPTTPLYAAISPDGARTWNPRTSVEVSGYPNSMRAVRDPNGIVHVIFEAPDRNVLGAPALVRHVTFADGHWGPVETASSRPTGTRLILSATDRGIMISWGEGVEYLGGQVPRSYAAWWDSSCKH